MEFKTLSQILCQCGHQNPFLMVRTHWILDRFGVRFAWLHVATLHRVIAYSRIAKQLCEHWPFESHQCCCTLNWYDTGMILAYCAWLQVLQCAFNIEGASTSKITHVVQKKNPGWGEQQAIESGVQTTLRADWCFATSRGWYCNLCWGYLAQPH